EEQQAEVEPAERLVVRQPAEPGEEGADHEGEKPESDEPEETGRYASTAAEEEKGVDLGDEPEQHRPAGERALAVVGLDHEQLRDRSGERDQGARVREE